MVSWTINQQIEGEIEMKGISAVKTTVKALQQQKSLDNNDVKGLLETSVHGGSKGGIQALSPATLMNACGVYTHNTDQDTPFEHVAAVELRRILGGMLSRLNLQQKAVIVFRFGLLDGINYSTDEVAELLGVSTHRVYSVEQRALYIMRGGVLKGNFVPRDLCKEAQSLL